MTTIYPISEQKRKFLHELPKCEHHVHLEGTLSPDLLFTLAKRNNIELPAHFPSSIELCNDRYEKFTDLQDFLDHYYIGMSVLMTESDFEDLAWDYFVKAKHDGLHHAETFFDPQGHVERGIPIETVVNGFHRASQRAQAELGISTKLIMCLLRHLPSQDGLKTINDAKQFYQDGIIHGLGLDSSEKPFPPELFEECYALAKKNCPEIGLTAHAGEEADPSFISNSLDLLKVTRIDHGVQSYRDDELLKRLAKDKVMISLCPLSNVKLQVVSDVGELPLRKWLDYGVPFSINSDDPAYFGGYLLDNYLAVESRFNLKPEEWVQITKNSVDGSWIDAARKKQLHDEIDRVHAKYRDVLV